MKTRKTRRKKNKKKLPRAQTDMLIFSRIKWIVMTTFKNIKNKNKKSHQAEQCISLSTTGCGAEQLQ